MIRAEVLVQAADGRSQDWRIDRGVITAISGTTSRFAEKDDTLVTIQVDPNARVTGAGAVASVAASCAPRLRVVVYHQANAPAELVQVEGVGG